MPWVFEECVQEYGHCIRQYTMLVLSACTAFLAVYSCYRNYKALKRLSFIMFPLAINIPTSLIVFVSSLQSQLNFTLLILFILEWYSYLLVHLAMIPVDKPKRIVLVVVTVLIALSLGVVSVLAAILVMRCREERLMGYVIIYVMEVGLYVYVSRGLWGMGRRLRGAYERDSETEVRRRQVRSVEVSFTLSVVFRGLCLGLYCVRDICQGKRQDFDVFLILFVEDVCALIPYVAIPYVFWYLPMNSMRKASTVYMGRQQPINESGNNGSESDFSMLNRLIRKKIEKGVSD